MKFEENVKIYEKYDKIDDIPYGSRVELKVGDKSYITGTYQGLCGGFAIDISGHTYSLSQIQEIKVNIVKEENFKLGDIVEVTNIDGLNRVLYSEYSKGFNKNLIGLQGKIIMIDETTDKNITYYLVKLYIDSNSTINSRAIFLKENLKLIRKRNDVKVDNSRFFDPSNFKPLNYKDLDGKTLKMTVVDNDECLLVAGVDKENNTIYMLHSEVK